MKRHHALLASAAALAVMVGAAHAGPSFSSYQRVSGGQSSQAAVDRDFSLFATVRDFVRAKLGAPDLEFVAAATSTAKAEKMSKADRHQECEDSKASQNDESKPEDLDATAGPEPIYFGF